MIFNVPTQIDHASSPVMVNCGGRFVGMGGNTVLGAYKRQISVVVAI